MTGLSKIWKDKDLRVSIKCRLVRVMVFPISTYGCETWTLNKANKNKINAFEMWCWRRLLRIPWTAKRTNASVMKEIGGKTKLLATVLRLKMSYFGHVIRGEGLEKDVMLG